LPEIKGIARDLVQILTEKSNELGQGRSVGTIGFLDENGYISKHSRIVNGGLSGLPYRQLLSGVAENNTGPLLELINQLPENAVVVSTAPGKTGIITSTGGINIFNQPIVRIGIKEKKTIGIGVLYPEEELFELASLSEKIELETLAATTMEEERQALKKSAKLKLKYLEISGELPVVDIPVEEDFSVKKLANGITRPDISIKGISLDFARQLVKRSTEVEQGREIAAIGVIDDEGYVIQAGGIVDGGMGYVPSRLLASSYTDISTVSLRTAYTSLIPDRAVIVHTHPGGTGVMHMGDAMAGPGTWGRPIIAIGHDSKGDIRGATVIEYENIIGKLADEYEELEQLFFETRTAEEEATLRKRRYEIAQEFTDLCRKIELN